MYPRFLFLIIAVAVPVAGANDEPGPWRAALQYNYVGASQGFAALRAVHPEDARATVAYASVLLVQQPRTDGKIREAYTLLSQVAVSTTQHSQEEALLANYLLARVEQDHLSPAQPTAARERYEKLIRNYPYHALAGLATVQLALLDSSRATTGTATAVAAHIETLLSGAKREETARELHFILGRLHWELRHDARTALQHLTLGRALGYEKPFRNAEVDLSIGNLAKLVGDRELALAHYRAFLEENKRDVRSGTVRRLVSELEIAAKTP